MLKPTAEVFAVSLAAGRPVAEAARGLDLAERTAYRWAASAKMKARVAELRIRMTDEAIGQLSGAAAEAAAVLRAVMTDPENPPTARVAAARAILSDLLSLREHLDLAGRLAELEGRLAESPEGGYRR